MKVKILCEFNVPDTDDENIAKSAASMAAYNFLSFCVATDKAVGRDVCEVHVDGHGKFRVEIGTDHE